MPRRMREVKRELRFFFFVNGNERWFFRYITSSLLLSHQELRESLERELAEIRADRSRLKSLLEAEHSKCMLLQKRLDEGGGGGGSGSHKHLPYTHFTFYLILFRSHNFF
jgi:hypothetical protein